VQRREPEAADYGFARHTIRRMTPGRWLTLAVVSAATAMLLLDVTVVNVALPAIRDELDASFAELQWVVDAYALTLAATLLTIGPLVGGLLVDGLGWRWVFLVNLPIGVVLTWLTLRSVRESRDPSPRGLDLPGLVTFGAACFLGTFGLIRGNEDGWASAPVLGSLGAALGLLAAFVAIERRAAAPMLSPALFRIPAFTGTAIVAFAQSVALYPLFLFLAVYLQQGLGYSATGTGLRLLPLTLVLFTVAPISGRLTGRIPLRIPMVTGLALIAAALLLMRGLTETSGWTHLLPGFLVGGLAIGIISPALAAAMVGVLSADQVRRHGRRPERRVQRGGGDRRRRCRDRVAAARGAPGSDQPGGELVERLGQHVVVGPQAAALGVHDAGVAQLLEVVAERRLGHLEEGDQLVDADLAGVLAQDVDELQADRVADRLGDLGHAQRLLALDVGIDDRLAARLGSVRALGLRGELQIDGHRCRQ
jgi:hypothetical protein